MSKYPRNVLAEHTRPLPALRFDINEVAGILRMSRAQLYKRIAEGGIKIQKDGARTYVTLKEIERYVEACGKGSTPSTPAAVKDAADLRERTYSR
ncbi:MAG: helix-turn-helix domain-containing protein [Steroidobacteraceae bacterium]